MYNNMFSIDNILGNMKVQRLVIPTSVDLEDFEKNLFCQILPA